MQPKLWQISIVLMVGILSVSAAAIFIRLAMDSANDYSIRLGVFLAALRLSISALVLFPTWKNIKQEKVSSKAFYFAIAAGSALGFHFATWISSLAFTSVAISTTLVTTSAIWVALLSRWWFREKLSFKATVGIGVALFGSIFIAVGDSNSIGNNQNPLLGSVLAFIGAIMASCYILFGKQAREAGLSLSNYIALSYSSAALIVLPLPLIFGVSYESYPKEVYFYGFLMAVFSQLIGHTSFNWALRWLSPSIVGVSILAEPIGSSILAGIFLQEVPTRRTVIGGLILLLGVILAIINPKSKEL